LYAQHNKEVKYINYVPITYNVYSNQNYITTQFTYCKQYYLLAYHWKCQLQTMKSVGLSEQLTFKKLLRHIPGLI